MRKTKTTYNLTYYNKNKDKLLDNMKEKIKCECGAEICKINLYRHLKTNKHQKFLNRNICQIIDDTQKVSIDTLTL